MFGEPQSQHQWLQQLIGEWTYQSESSSDDPDGCNSAGTESVRALGGFWIQAEGTGEMGGQPTTMIITLGFDPQKDRFVGTWVGSMMSNLWIYEGELDAAGKVLTLNSEGPSFSGDGTIDKYQDIIEILDEDHRNLYGQVLGKDGQWNRFMTTRYTRKK